VVGVAGRPKKGTGLAPLEAAVMNAVWNAAAPVSVRQILDTLNADRADPLAYTTVMTVMNRLTAKGVLRRQGRPRSYVYEATASDPAAIATRDLLATYGDAAIVPFIEQARADPAMLRRLRRLLREDPQ
jgi:predicted transcriptional regulator